MESSLAQETLALRSRPPCTGVPQRVPSECFLALFAPKGTQEALLAALRARCPEALKKHFMGHFPARAPGHSCKWRPESQLLISSCWPLNSRWTAIQIMCLELVGSDSPLTEKHNENATIMEPTTNICGSNKLLKLHLQRLIIQN